jgi:O-antigen/teichoic acid export membrane protein
MVLLMLPFFTRILSPTEFGQIAVVATLASALSVLATLGLETAVFRGYLANRGDLVSGRRFINTVGGFAIVAAIAGATVLGLIAAAPLSAILDIPADAIRLASVGAGASAAATTVPLALLRAQERTGDYLRLTGLQVAVTPVLTVLFILAFNWGVVGWMFAYALSSLTLLARGVWLLGHQWRFEFNLTYLVGALVFGLPLVPHALSHWGLSLSDRVILGAYVAAPDVAAYYVAYLVCLPISLVTIALSQATQPFYAEAGGDSARLKSLKPFVVGQTVVTLLATAAVVLIGPSICLLLLPDIYASAAALVPWLAVGAFLFGIYLVPVAAIILVAARTEHLWAITLGAAAANVVLNIAFVPTLGTLAAAINTVVSYGLLLIGVLAYMWRVCRLSIPYDANRILTATLVVGVPTAAAGTLLDAGSLLGLTARMLVLAAIGVVVAVGPLRSEAVAAWSAYRAERGVLS